MMPQDPTLLTKVKYADHYDELEVLSWCYENCPSGFYIGRDWETWVDGELNRYIQFVDERDALLFLLWL